MSHNRRGGVPQWLPEECNTINHYSFACCAPWYSSLDEQKR